MENTKELSDLVAPARPTNEERQYHARSCLYSATISFAFAAGLAYGAAGSPGLHKPMPVVARVIFGGVATIPLMQGVNTLRERKRILQGKDYTQ